MTKDERREYFRKWVKNNPDKMAEYQRRFNEKRMNRTSRESLTTKGDPNYRSLKFIAPRETVKSSYHYVDWMAAPVEKIPELFDRIVTGRVVLAQAARMEE